MKKYIFIIFIIAIATVLPRASFASETNGTITTSSAYAWGENLGWVNFGCDNCSTQITDTAVTGSVWSRTYGWINLNPDNGGITNDSEGNLGGTAWSSQLGWLSFSSVIINSSGLFTGIAGAEGSTTGRVNFDCNECSVSTDWRPASIRNTGDTSPTPFLPGGGGIIGGGGSGILDHINSLNYPLTILPSQSGTYTQDTTSGKIILDIPKNNITSKTTIIIKEEPLVDANLHLISIESDLINNAFYDVTAWDENGNRVKQFPYFITITLPIPKELVGVSDLGVYWLDEDNSRWILISDTVFNLKKAEATFQVNHLTKFAIFGTIGKPEILPTKHKETGIFTVATKFIKDIISHSPKAEQLTIPEQLFDINLEIDDATISNIKELVARVIFISFGTVPTPVDMTFIIKNETGEEVYRDEGESVDIVVETEAVFTKKFEELELASGKYTLVLRALYNVDVEDEFRQDFEIVETKTYFVQAFWIFLFILFVTWYLIFLKRKRQKYHQSYEG